jgi:hypothetical protein
MSTYKVIAVPTTPLSAMENELNAQAGDGFEFVAHFFGSDGTHHVAGGVQPEIVEETVNGVKVKRVINKVVMIFRHV